MKLIRFHNPNDAMANGYVVANFGELPTCRYYGLSFKLPTPKQAIAIAFSGARKAKGKKK